MTNDCEVIRDLLPLYADDACSRASRTLVEGHLAGCADCRTMLVRLRSSEIEQDLRLEKQDVIRYGEKRFKRRSAAVGMLVAGLFMLPILVCLVVNLASGNTLDWFFVVLASLAVAASLVITPLTVPEDKLFWTFCAFCVSLVILLAVTCLYSGGNWFWIAASAALFGLAVIFLPFVVRAKPVKRLIGGASKGLIVLGLDAALFVNMMNMIFAANGFRAGNLLLSLGTLAGIALIVLEVIRQGGNKNEQE